MENIRYQIGPFQVVTTEDGKFRCVDTENPNSPGLKYRTLKYAIDVVKRTAKENGYKEDENGQNS